MIEKPHRIVVDSNVLVAAMILRGSTPAKAIRFAVLTSAVLISEAMIQEVEDVFRRSKFDRYDDLEARLDYLWSFIDAALPVTVIERVSECRDPKDNIVLELALCGKADYIITGDADLLSLHPWRGIGILSPADYLALSE